jgi:hypothetical protein
MLVLHALVLRMTLVTDTSLVRLSKSDSFTLNRVEMLRHR